MTCIEKFFFPGSTIDLKEKDQEIASCYENLKRVQDDLRVSCQEIAELKVRDGERLELLIAKGEEINRLLKMIAELKEANVEKAAKIVDLIETCRLQRATIAQLQDKSKETEGKQ
jgi:hypothetical protein